MGGARLVMTLDLPEETPSNNVLKGLHFHAYKTMRRKWRALVQAAADAAEKPSRPIERALLQIERHCAGGGLDWDNCYGGLKPLLDCLVAPSPRNPDGLAFIEDDNPKNMPRPPRLLQLPAKRGQGRTVVRIFDAKDLDEGQLARWS